MNVCLFSRIIKEHGVKGGMEVHGDIISRGLLERGHGITIITGEHPDGKKFDIGENKKIYYLPGVTPYKYTRRWWSESAKKFIEIAKEEKFDIVWSQSAGALAWIKFLRKKYNIPCVATIHGTPFSGLKTKAKSIFLSWSIFRFFLSVLKSIYYKFVWYKNYRFMSAVIVVAQNLIKPFNKGYFFNKENIFYIPNGVDVDRFSLSINEENIQNLREKYQINKEDRVLFTAGRLEKEKGIQCTIKSLPKIITHTPKIKLMIVGDGIYKDELKKLVRKLKIEDFVIFCGFIERESLPAYYNLCDVFLMSTCCYEGFPLVIAEAMACSKPIIASKIGGIPSVIDDGINGILIPPGDVNALVQKIIFLLKNKELREKLAENAREKVEKEFNQKKMVSNTIEIFEKCIKDILL